jgi:hypothetical protein
MDTAFPADDLRDAARMACGCPVIADVRAAGADLADVNRKLAAFAGQASPS